MSSDELSDGRSFELTQKGVFETLKVLLLLSTVSWPKLLKSIVGGATAWETARPNLLRSIVGKATIWKREIKNK
jgi:hypothetical protein